MKFFARNQIRNLVSQETKHKTIKHQKNNRLFLRNKWLFIPTNQQLLNLNEFKGRKRYTNILYWFTLKPRSTSSPQNPLGNPLSNQLQITHKITKEVTLNPSRNILPLAHHTPRMLILTTSRAHNTPWLTTPEFTKYSEQITLVTEWTEINTDVKEETIGCFEETIGCFSATYWQIVIFKHKLRKVQNRC